MCGRSILPEKRRLRYLVEQERMANAQLLMFYGSKHLEQNFFFPLNNCEYPDTMGYSAIKKSRQI
jgi:hypothetical protein